MLSFDHVRQTMGSIEEDVLTLYLRVDNGYRPNQSDRPAWRIYVKDALKSVPDTEAGDRIREQVNDFVQGYQPTSRSLVMFVGENTFHTHELPVTLENQHYYGEPMLVPLLWAIDEYERYLVVLVDQEQARFVSAYLGAIDVSDEMQIDFEDYDFRNKRYINDSGAPRGENAVATQGGGRDNFDDMHRAHLTRFYNDIAEAIRETLGEMGSERVILAGSEKSANEVYRQLHQSVQEKVVSIMNLRTDAAEHEISEAIQEDALAYEREKEMELVDEVINLAKAGGRGALGIEAVGEAFQMQQIEVLILPFPPTDEADAELITTLTQRAIESSARIELVHGAPAAKLRHEATVAARLYYFIQESTEES